MKPKDFPPQPSELAHAEPSALVQSAKGYALNARAQGTLTAYRKHWAAFSAWCAKEGLCELPAAPQTLALYLAAHADEGRKLATLSLALSAISQAHAVAGHPSPRSDRLAQETWKGIRRRLGIAQQQKDPLSARNARAAQPRLGRGWLVSLLPVVARHSSRCPRGRVRARARLERAAQPLSMLLLFGLIAFGAGVAMMTLWREL